MIYKIKLNDTNLDELEKYYKYIAKCKKCGITYGYDDSKDNGVCPICTDNCFRKQEVK